MYKCGWNGCEKAYGTLNHLNAHVTMQSHGQKRTPEGMFYLICDPNDNFTPINYICVMQYFKSIVSCSSCSQLIFGVLAWILVPCTDLVPDDSRWCTGYDWRGLGITSSSPGS